MAIRQGDAYWADVGEPVGSETGFRRPYLVVQNNATNATNIGTILACAITGNLARASGRGNVFLERGEANLPRASVVVVSQVLNLDRLDFEEFLGSLPIRRVRQVLTGIYEIFEPREPVD